MIKLKTFGWFYPWLLTPHKTGPSQGISKPKTRRCWQCLRHFCIFGNQTLVIHLGKSYQIVPALNLKIYLLWIWLEKIPWRIIHWYEKTSFGFGRLIFWLRDSDPPKVPRGDDDRLGHLTYLAHRSLFVVESTYEWVCRNHKVVWRNHKVQLLFLWLGTFNKNNISKSRGFKFQLQIYMRISSQTSKIIKMCWNSGCL